MARSIHIDLLGTETRFVNGERYTTRIIEVLNDKPPLILLHGGGGHAGGAGLRAGALGHDAKRGRAGQLMRSRVTESCANILNSFSGQFKC